MSGIIDERTERLIQAALDGTASLADRERLAALVASDPAVRARHDELSELFTALGAVRREAAPAGLRADVMRAISAEPRRAPVRVGWLAGLVASFAQRPGRALGFGFAGGAVAGIAVFALVTGAGRDRSLGTLPTTGTMAPAAAERMAATRVLRTLRVGDADIVIVASRDTGALALKVRVSRGRDTANCTLPLTPER